MAFGALNWSMIPNSILLFSSKMRIFQQSFLFSTLHLIFINAISLATSELRKLILGSVLLLTFVRALEDDDKKVRWKFEIISHLTMNLRTITIV